MLTLSNLSLSFHRYGGLIRREQVERLSALSFTVAPGELVAVVGTSGAGKSLLAHAILGLLPPNANLKGEMTFKGASLMNDYPKGLRGKQIALMPQDIGHLDPLAKVGAQIRWSGRRAGNHKVDPVAQLLDVGLSPEVADRFPSELSGGMARRVLMALSLVGSPNLLVADEPTVGLDPDNRDRILKRLRDQASGERSVLLITHDLSAVLPLVDRVVILDQGRLLGIERADDFSGSGIDLQSEHARALWQALPQNGFYSYA